MTSAHQPPLASRRPQSVTHHGITVTDDYAWLKDARWQEVLRDPSLLQADIRSYLEAENAHTEALLGGTAALQTKLVAEMRGRIKEDDSSVPSPDGAFEYFQQIPRRRPARADRPLTPRRRRGRRILLDGDALAAQSSYFRFGGARHSWDHRLHAWSADLNGSEYFTIRVRDWATVAGYRRHRRADRRRRGLERGFEGLLLRASSMTIIGRCRSCGTASAHRSRTTCWSTRKRIPAGSPISTRAPADVSASSPAATTRPPNST